MATYPHNRFANETWTLDSRGDHWREQWNQQLEEEMRNKEASDRRLAAVDQRRVLINGCVIGLMIVGSVFKHIGEQSDPEQIEKSAYKMLEPESPKSILPPEPEHLDPPSLHNIPMERTANDAFSSR